MVGTVPRSLADWMWPFVRCFTGSTWDHVLVLVAGALLSPGRRTVSTALRVMDLDQTASFAVYHRVLSTARWSARRVAHRLLHLLVAAFVGEGPVVIGLDDTIERQWGTKIKARGICKGRMKFPQMWRVKIPQTVCLVTVCLVMDGCLAESTSFSVAVPGGAVEVERG
jgi:hypothetical protein